MTRWLRFANFLRRIRPDERETSTLRGREKAVKRRVVPIMADIRDGFKDIFLAGVGALAYGGERANELVNNLIEKGELTVEQGKELNTELQHKANETFGQVRDEALAAQLKAMTPEQRAEFVAKVNELADKVTDDAAAAAVADAGK